MSRLFSGFARCDITPPLGCATAGYFEPHYAQEIVNSLYADALVVRDEHGDSAALVDCDVIALSDATVRRMRRKIQQCSGIPEERILISATHTHTGPYTLDIFEGSEDKGYLETLPSCAAKAVAEALSHLAPSQVRIASVPLEGISCNRRMLFQNGEVHTHTSFEDIPEIIGAEGPVDQELIALEFRSMDGGLLGHVINFALHPTNVRGDRICSDYPGYIAEQIALRTGQESLALFLNSACGNIDSKTPQLESIAYGPERGAHIAGVIAETALEALAKTDAVLTGPIATARKTVEIPLKSPSTEMLRKAEAFLATYSLDGILEDPSTLFFTKGTRRPSLPKEKVYALEAIHMAEKIRACPYARVEVMAIRIGGVILFGFPVELFCEFGLEVKRMARDKGLQAAIVELANGCFGYVPVPKSFEGGGYETRLARSSQLAPEAGGLLCQAAGELLETLAG